MAFTFLAVAFGGNRIGKGEIGGILRTFISDPFKNQSELLVEHLFYPALRDIPMVLLFAVDGITEVHIVGGNGFCDGSGGTPGSKKKTRHLLTGPDLGNGAVFGQIHV